MQAHTLRAALGAMANVPQYFVWRLTWDDEENKYIKQPWGNPHVNYPIDAQLPHNWVTFEEASRRVAEWSAIGTHRYALGFMLTPGCGWWFLDIDKCIVAGQYTSRAAELMSMLPGCFIEFSSSGTGVHVIGRGTVPTHSKRNKAEGMELYTEKRGIAFGLTGEAWGSADVGSPAIASIADLYFPPAAEGEAGAFLTPRADWAGPTDDDELIAKMLASTSVAARFGTKATARQLWTADPDALAQFYGGEGRTERDAALAAHLAFWTGCDAPRMERLMRRSALVREKWDTHRTYLRELTIERACARQGEVYRDAASRAAAALYAVPPLPALPGLPALPLLAPLPASVVTPITPELEALVNTLIAQVNASGTWADVHNTVIPAIRDARLPAAILPRMETAVNKRLDLWGAKLPLAELRVLLRSGQVSAGDGVPAVAAGTAPLWAANYTYVQQLDGFFNVLDGTPLTRTSFNAIHNRSMPIKGDGPQRQDAAQFMLEHWGCPVVYDTIYYPGQPNIMEYEGRTWANLYSESSFPVAAEHHTVSGAENIERFKSQLWQMCGKRQRVYEVMLAWMAHNVQKPGVKIRWAPIVRGVEGDGKTTISKVLQAAMGPRNAIAVGPGIVANGGGFTDWAHGHAFVALEEMYLPGKERYRIYNIVKEFVTNDDVTINPKGGKPKKVRNTSNQIAFTNHSDALPIDALTDRRWLVIFTPWGNLAEMRRILGVDKGKDHFGPLYASLKFEPAQWRKWLMDYQIPDWFDPDEEALWTAEKQTMATSGADDVEMLARNVIAGGFYGVSNSILSSSCLSTALKIASADQGVELPKTNTMHHMLNRFGFIPVEGHVKWGGKAHRVWVKPGISQNPDNLRHLLQITVTSP